uniref:Uncharacterized protein n=1 Tax=Romanomermis culicivorax TaxID=13658 RepID=A0A915KRB2_ROMCU
MIIAVEGYCGYFPNSFREAEELLKTVYCKKFNQSCLMLADNCIAAVLSILNIWPSALTRT